MIRSSNHGSSITGGEQITDCREMLSVEERTQVMERVVAAFAHMMYVDGLFQADPHPGNILLHRATAAEEEEWGTRWMPVILF